jgi:tetratricopeptide (TPR) repeat protein
MNALSHLMLAAGMMQATTAPSPASTQLQTGALAEAKTALDGGEADKALAVLDPVLHQVDGVAEAHNLACRVWLIVGRADEAAKECEKALSLDPQDAMEHLWLGRALGDKADHASFLSAYSLAKRVRTEFEEAVRLDPQNAEALASLGEFDCSAPGVVGGGLDKAENVAAQLEKVDLPKALELRAQIAEQRKDYETAEHALKQAIAAGPHPAYQWMALASFYRRRERWAEMAAAVRSGANLARHDKHAAVALYNGAGTLTRANRELQLAEKLLEEYLASANKTEEGPAFVAYGRLARVEDELGDANAANRDRAAALALAHEYKVPEGPKH